MYSFLRKPHFSYSFALSGLHIKNMQSALFLSSLEREITQSAAKPLPRYFSLVATSRIYASFPIISPTAREAVLPFCLMHITLVLPPNTPLPVLESHSRYALSSESGVLPVSTLYSSAVMSQSGCAQVSFCGNSESSIRTAFASAQSFPEQKYIFSPKKEANYESSRKSAELDGQIIVPSFLFKSTAVTLPPQSV